MDDLNALSAWANLAADGARWAEEDAAKLPERALAALVLIESHPSCSLDWLYRRLEITQSGTVRLLDRLQDSELVERTRPPGQREIEITITDAGRAVLSDGLAARRRALQDLLAPLTERERRQLTTLIGKALSGAPLARTAADTACRLCDWPGCGDACPVDAAVRQAS